MTTATTPGGTSCAGTAVARNGTVTRVRRALAVVAATAAATALWAIGRYAAGIHVHSPGMSGHRPVTVGAEAVIAAAAVAGLAGWALLAVLERLSTHARTAWTVTAIVVALLSVSAPLSGTSVSASSRTLLVLLHVTVAATLIPLMRRSSTAR